MASGGSNGGPLRPPRKSPRDGGTGYPLTPASMANTDEDYVVYDSRGNIDLHASSQKLRSNISQLQADIKALSTSRRSHVRQQLRQALSDDSDDAHSVCSATHSSAHVSTKHIPTTSSDAMEEGKVKVDHVDFCPPVNDDFVTRRRTRLATQCLHVETAADPTMSGVKGERVTRVDGLDASAGPTSQFPPKDAEGQVSGSSGSNENKQAVDSDVTRAITNKKPLVLDK